MSRTKTFTGKTVDADPRTCEPLHNMVGLELCAEFMGMYDVQLSNGHTARVFKHRFTREYIHLDRTEPGLAYEYTSNGRYRPVPLGVALLKVFGWNPNGDWRYGPGCDDPF